MFESFLNRFLNPLIAKQDAALCAVAGYALGTVDSDSVTLAPTRQVKARQTYLALRNAWSGGATLPTLDEVKCSVWFDYLCSGWDTAAAAIDSLHKLYANKPGTVNPPSHMAGEKKWENAIFFVCFVLVCSIIIFFRINPEMIL
jgi:hypothetical protein